MEALAFCSHRTTSLPVPNSTSSVPSFGRRTPSSRDLSLFFLKIPSLRASSLSGGRRLRVSAGLERRRRRASKRRNTLREKLVDGEPTQVRGTPEESGPRVDSQVGLVAKDENAGDFQTNPAVDEKKEELFDGDGLGSSDVTRESVLWSRLDNWVDQYKRDNEFWGVGTGPIFSVYQDSDGNVGRVSVNEDEIVRRSRIEAWSPRFREEGRELDVKSKMKRAMLIAKEVECGEFKFPDNSSIAKYVAEGKKVSHIDGFQSAILRGRTLMRFCPQIGLTVLVGYFVYWAVKNPLLGGGRSEPTSEEKEMLRRKLKARKESNTVVVGMVGNVEVVQDAKEMLVGLDKRPELDRDELMKNVIEGKTSKRTSVMLESSGDPSVCGHSFEDKVSEIREMARKARESESLELQSNNNGGQSDMYFNENNLQPNVKNLIVESRIDTDEDRRDLSDDDSIAPSEVADEAEKESQRPSLNNSSLSSNGSYSMKPKIIMSIKEAREYLSQKNKIPNGKMRSQQDSNNRQLAHDYDTLNGKEVHTSSEGSENVEYPTATGASRGDTEKVCFPMDTVEKSLPHLEKVMDEKEEFVTVTIDTHAGDTENVRLPMDTAGKTLPHLEKVMDPLESNDDGRPSKSLSIVGVENFSVPDDIERAEIGAKRDKALEVDAEYHNSQSKVDSLCKETLKNQLGSVSKQNKMASLPTDVQWTESQKNSTGKSFSPISGSAKGRKEKMKPVKKSASSSLVDEPDAQEMQAKTVPFGNTISGIDCNVNIKGIIEKENMRMDDEIETPHANPSQSGIVSDPALLVNSIDASIREKEDGRFNSQIFPNADDLSKDLKPSSVSDKRKMEANDINPQHSNNSGVPMCDTNSNQETDAANHNTESGPAQAKKNWMEENFKKFDPVVEKIGVGFRENYMIAKEKKEDQKLINAEISELGLMEDDEELQWMNDEKLRDIVFQVRDNELAGREPFHLMSNDDQHTYFEGLVKKAEKVNGKLLGLHEFIHSRIENIDYGADGISVHDPLEKIMPRWKGPPIDKGAEFLNNPIWNKQASAEGSRNASTIGDNGSELHKSQEQSCTDDVSGYSVHNIRKPPNGGSSKARTVIECSDGSSKVGKKGGKEHWQHTKKWSREFLELYNAETDPETKSVMRDMGKDLDKWIAEKEIQDVADLMARIPKKKRQFIEKKLDKLKREVEMFGPQAVVSKYREYSDEKEEDYLWWLDLKFVLCIELYNVENDAQKIGFYSLEMAEDLELNPKQYHIIAFEDPGDAKNFCYIMQAHLEMLGKGRAFVVPQPPKDAFQEAKANGFHVTVIRKGEIKLNIDQTLEEVEEEIIEIGTKMYHDKIMHERGVDMGALMKGVLASDKSNKRRRSKRILKKSAAQ